eukprot:Hpha_TRINITY_DN3150_c0_g1::TRINITY_DN3150_c0_g1_i1::g.96790::m.96790
MGKPPREGDGPGGARMEYKGQQLGQTHLVFINIDMVSAKVGEGCGPPVISCCSDRKLPRCFVDLTSFGVSARQAIIPLFQFVHEHTAVVPPSDLRVLREWHCPCLPSVPSPCSIKYRN